MKGLKQENDRIRCAFVKKLTAVWRTEVWFKLRCRKSIYVIIAVRDSSHCESSLDGKKWDDPRNN